MKVRSISDAGEELEDVVERFESAHRRGERPSIEDFVASARTIEERRRWLVELIHADLECCLATADVARAEDYFARFPEIARDEEISLEIIFAEFDLRSQHETGVSWDELIARFPQYRRRLQEHTTVGRFRLLSRLGEGSFGVVWKAEDLQLERIVAVKLPSPGRLVTRVEMERFLREGRNIARLRHVGIVSVHEVGTDEGIPYLVSEYLDGKPLSKLIAEGALAPRQAAELVAQVADALQYAHSLGVVHRDIKPSNIMLCKPAIDVASRIKGESEWQAKLTDFGLSRRIDADRTLTQAGDILGTPAYITPEQASGNGDPADPRGDIYSLGVVLYQLLAGSVPFHGNTPAIFHQVIHDDPPSIRRIDPTVQRDLEAVCLKCLEKYPQKRYATAGALADDLRRWLRNEPTIARPASVSRRAAQWARRRPAVAALWIVSLLALAGIIGTNQWRLNQLNIALRQANGLRTVAELEQANATRANDASRKLLYVAQIQNAQQAWREGNVRQMQAILAQYGDGTPNADLRHFEWYHLNYLSDVPHRELVGHAGEAYAVAYSPDSRILLTGGQDGTVRLWDPTTCKPLEVLAKHTSCVNCIDFAPDGDTFATASCDKSIKLWSLNRRQVIKTFNRDQLEFDDCTFSDDGKLLIAVSRGLPEQTGPLPRIALVWDVSTGEVISDWPPPEEVIDWMTWSRPCRTIVTHGNGVAKVWNREGSTWTESHLFGLDDFWRGFLAPDAEHLLVPGWPSRLRTIRLRDGVIVNQQDARGGQVSHVSFSPSGKYFASCAESLRVWEFPSGIAQYQFCSPFGIWRSAWSHSEQSIATAGSDGVVRIWDLRLGKPHILLEVPESYTRPIRGIAFSRDGKRLSANDSRQQWTCDLATGQVISNAPFAEPILPIEMSGRSPDGRRVARSVNGGIAICDAASGDEILRLDLASVHQRFAFAPDGRSLVSVSDLDNSFYYWPGKR